MRVKSQGFAMLHHPALLLHTKTHFSLRLYFEEPLLGHSTSLLPLERVNSELFWVVLSGDRLPPHIDSFRSLSGLLSDIFSRCLAFDHPTQSSVFTKPVFHTYLYFTTRISNIMMQHSPLFCILSANFLCTVEYLLCTVKYHRAFISFVLKSVFEKSTQ